MRITSRSASVLGALAIASLSGCAKKVTQTEFESEVAKIRDEMQTGDRQLATRIDSVDSRVNALEQQLQAFRSEYNVSVEKMKGAMKFNVPVHFEFGSADLREGDRPVLDRFAGVVKEYYPNATITIEGFADPAGGTRFNKQLGMRRAEAVAGYLSSNGSLDASFIRAVSYGESRERQIVPGAMGPGDQGLENRRVALVIDYAAPGATAGEQVSVQ